MWVDADTSCVWGASTVMRFVCDKHNMSPGAYAVEVSAPPPRSPGKGIAFLKGFLTG